MYIFLQKKSLNKMRKSKNPRIDTCGIPLFVFLSLKEKNLNFITLLYFYFFLFIAYRKSGQIHNCSLNSNTTVVQLSKFILYNVKILDQKRNNCCKMHFFLKDLHETSDLLATECSVDDPFQKINCPVSVMLLICK